MNLSLHDIVIVIATYITLRDNILYASSFKTSIINNSKSSNPFLFNRNLSHKRNVVYTRIAIPKYRTTLFLNFDNFSDNAVKVLMLSQEEAKRTSQPMIETAHVFQGLLCLNKGMAAQILKGLGVTIDSVRNSAKQSLSSGNDDAAKDNVKPSNLLTFSPSAKKSLEFSSHEAERLGSSIIETEHLLLGVLNDRGAVMTNIFRILAIDADALREETLKNISQKKDAMDSKMVQDPLQNNITIYTYMPSSGVNRGDIILPTSLSSFTVDLSYKAENGMLSKVIHRDNEIERAIITLCRKTKRNVLLIGEPGVGKTAIVEGIANKISEGNSLPLMSGKRIHQLEMGLLIAGTKFRGQFEERLTKLIDEIKSLGNIILVVDEAHMLIGAGAGDGALDAANLLKPALSRGEIQCIAITTPKEYKKYFEKDLALSRRFQPIYVNEPSDDDTLKILTEISESYGKFHNVKYSPETIKLTVKYAKRYITDRFMPDKSIDLLDESGSLAKLRRKKEMLNDNTLTTVDSTNIESNDSNSNISNAVEKSIEPEGTIEVTQDHVAEIVSRWTGIPLTKLTENEMESLRNMEEDLHKMVIGQDDAIKNVCKAIRRAKTNIKNPERPIGSFLFCGPPGVGKSEVSRSLTKYLFAKENIIRLDMSEYSEPHSISRILGSPPGYKGHDSGGQLTEKLRNNPYSVVMFDEIEKAHKDVLNVLLQILEDGKLTDAKNQAVSFKNAIIIMTSNVGSNVIQRASKGIHSFGFTFDDDQTSDYLRMKSIVLEELKSHFLPELINRIDDVILFKPLSEKDLFKIANIMLKDLVSRASEAGIQIKVGDEFVNYILKLPRDENCGARPLRRLITTVLEDQLAELMISQDYDSKTVYLVTVESGSVKVIPENESRVVNTDIVVPSVKEYSSTAVNNTK